MGARIPATVITGFLGAGKTTLLRHLLEHAEGRRIAVVVNEFGEMGIDGGLLQGCGLEACDDEGGVVELANGCICCTVAEEFLPAMEGILARTDPPDHIVIETSGLALPQPLVRAFNWPEIRNRVTVDAVVALADAAALAAGRLAEDESALEERRRGDALLDHDTPLGELFEDQLASADLLLLNKTDLVPGSAIPQLERELEARMRRGARVIHSAFCRVPLGAVFGIGAGAEADLETRTERHHHHEEREENGDHDGMPHGGVEEQDHGHDAFVSFSLAVNHVVDPDVLADRIREAMRRFEIYRIKGFGAVGNRPLRAVFQAAGPRTEYYFDRILLDGERDGVHLVVIGRAGLDRGAVTEVLTS